MRTAIIGSRDFDDGYLFTVSLSEFKITHIVSGGAKGADTLAKDYSEVFNIPITVYLPEWDQYGKAAGFIRNKTIIEDCEQVIAFWNGFSKGTEHSINLARRLNKETYIILT